MLEGCRQTHTLLILNPEELVGLFPGMKGTMEITFYSLKKMETKVKSILCLRRYLGGS